MCCRRISNTHRTIHINADIKLREIDLTYSTISNHRCLFYGNWCTGIRQKYLGSQWLHRIISRLELLYEGSSDIGSSFHPDILRCDIMLHNLYAFATNNLSTHSVCSHLHTGTRQSLQKNKLTSAIGYFNHRKSSINTFAFSLTLT